MLTKKAGWILGKDKLIINTVSRLEVTRPSWCFYVGNCYIIMVFLCRELLHHHGVSM